jgi:ABC-type glutathione transport system ATPase component
MQLQRHSLPLTPDVEYGPITEEVVGPFDVLGRLDELVSFTPWALPDLPESWGIGLIVGPSGSGKSLLIEELGGATPAPEWRDKHPIVEHFDPVDAGDRLAAVGLNDVPTWCRPYRVLSNGQKFRADLARQIGDGAIIDEFTSVVSRPVAMSASNALRRWVRTSGTSRIVVASCHTDVEEWLQPDWVIDTETGEFRHEKVERRRWTNETLTAQLKLL